MITAIREALLPKSWADAIFWTAFSIPLIGLVWQATDRAVPAEVIERVVVTLEVPVGGNLIIRNKVLRKFPAEVTAYRTLYDGINLRHIYDVQKLPPKEPDDNDRLETFLVSQPIPFFASPGPSRLIVTVCWERPFNLVHQVWPVCVTTKTLYFTIVP